MTTELSPEIKAALKQYYQNRNLQRFSDVEWNKTADLHRIFALAKKEGWEVEAIAGVFWFEQPTFIGNRKYRVTEQNYESGGERNIRKHGLINAIISYLKQKVEP